MNPTTKLEGVGASPNAIYNFFLHNFALFPKFFTSVKLTQQSALLSSHLYCHYISKFLKR